MHTTAKDFIRKQGLITATTAYGADLDIHVLSPPGNRPPEMKEGPFGAWVYDAPERGRSDSYPFRMLKYITLDALPGADYVTVLQPRKTDEPKLVAALNSPSKDRIEVRVEIAGRTDVITLTSGGGSYRRGDGQAVALPVSLP